MTLAGLDENDESAKISAESMAVNGGMEEVPNSTMWNHLSARITIICGRFVLTPEPRVVYKRLRQKSSQQAPSIHSLLGKPSGSPHIIETVRYSSLPEASEEPLPSQAISFSGSEQRKHRDMSLMPLELRGQ